MAAGQKYQETGLERKPSGRISTDLANSGYRETSVASLPAVCRGSSNIQIRQKFRAISPGQNNSITHAIRVGTDSRSSGLPKWPKMRLKMAGSLLKSFFVSVDGKLQNIVKSANSVTPRSDRPK